MEILDRRFRQNIHLRLCRGLKLSMVAYREPPDFGLDNWLRLRKSKHCLGCLVLRHPLLVFQLLIRRLQQEFRSEKIAFGRKDLASVLPDRNQVAKIQRLKEQSGGSYTHLF